MLRQLSALALALAVALSAPAAVAQDAKAPAKPAAKAATPKVGADEKLCRYRFPDGEQRAWTCKKVEPCCAWDAIKYVKCGSTITGCL